MIFKNPVPASQETHYVLGSWLANSSAMKMEATCSSETPVDFKLTTRRYIPVLFKNCLDSRGLASGWNEPHQGGLLQQQASVVPGTEQRREVVCISISFVLSTSSRPVLGPTQLPMQWVPGALSCGSKEAVP
jgi:hypothetical protein